METMATEYDKKRISILAPAADNITFASDIISTWAPAQYEPWNYGNRSEPAALPESESNPKQQQCSDQLTPSASPGTQPWLGYYPSKHLQHSHQPQLQGDQGPTNQGLPPLPSVPPPQPPPPPEPCSSSTSWNAVVAGGTEQRVADGAGFSYSNYYKHQQQHVQLSNLGTNYGGQDGQTNRAPTCNASVPQSHVSANGSHGYGLSYAGNNAAISGDQYAYGSGNYSGHNYGFSQQQGNDSYSQNMGHQYQSSGAAPYPPVNSFSGTSSYTESASYQTTGTYYNAGVYQNTEGYPTSGYTSHPNSWSDGSYVGYSCYAGYAAPDQGSTGGPKAVSNSNQLPQDFRPQWAEYNVNFMCNLPGNSETAPGTTPPSNPQTYASVVAQGSVSLSHAAVSTQPPPPGTQPSCWQPPSTPSFGSPAEINPSTSKAGSNWDGSTMQNLQADYQKKVLHTHSQVGPPHLPSMSKAQSQVQIPTLFQQGQKQQLPKVLAQKSSLESPNAHIIKSQGPTQIVPLWRAGKIQIPTNPRIASNFIGKGNSDVVSMQKTAYTSVAAKTGKLSSEDVTDATLQPGMFPSSLRAYVERALSRCKNEAQKSACQDIMKEMITAASWDGSLFTKDWDTEPLFPLPNIPSTSMTKEPGVFRHANIGISGIKLEAASSKRVKSRWEPVGENDIDERHGHSSWDVTEQCDRNREKERDVSLSPPRCEKRESGWNTTKSSEQQITTNTTSSRRFRRSSKRGRRSFGISFNGAASESESEEEVETSGPGVAAVAGVILGSLVVAETPEEKKRRQSRTKRFDGGKEGVVLKAFGKVKAEVGGTAGSRRATALQLAMSYGDGNGPAVEDIDWDSLTVRGTSQEIEKRYLRLTSAPDPSTVRPEDILKKALALVQSTPKSYLFKCEQLKSIRQDLTVQRIRDELTVQVYETHARMALESGDLPEYNQCQTQLKGLYAEGIRGCSNEFAGYCLLYIIFNHGNSRDLLSTMARLSKEARNDQAVKHALAVRAAVSLGNYTAFFKLYRTAPNLSPYLMDKHVEKMRFEAVKRMVRSYRPFLPVLYIARTLGFSGILTMEGGEEKEVNGVEECEEWLRTHGAHVKFDTSKEMVLDAKASSSSLFMPEPEDVIPHGDANLALNDFFSTRA